MPVIAAILYAAYALEGMGYDYLAIAVFLGGVRSGYQPIQVLHPHGSRARERTTGQ